MEGMSQIGGERREGWDTILEAAAVSEGIRLQKEQQQHHFCVQRKMQV